MLGKRSSSNISGSRQLVTCDHCGKENIERRKLKEHTSANHGNSDPRERLSKNQPKIIFFKPKQKIIMKMVNLNQRNQGLRKLVKLVTLI